MMNMENTDPGQCCATCGCKIQELSIVTDDRRIVCSRKCAVQGVTLPRGTPGELTVNHRSPASHAFSGPRLPAGFAWEPRVWMIGMRWDSHLVHLYVPMIRLSLERSELLRQVQRPYVWLPFCLLSVLALGVWLGTQATSVSVHGPSAQRDERGASLATTMSTPVLAVSVTPPTSVPPLEPSSAPSSSVAQAPQAPSEPRQAAREPGAIPLSSASPRATASTKPGSGCAYSFTVDAQGVKHPKLDCFDPMKDRF